MLDTTTDMPELTEALYQRFNSQAIGQTIDGITYAGIVDNRVQMPDGSAAPESPRFTPLLLVSSDEFRRVRVAGDAIKHADNALMTTDGQIIVKPDDQTAEYAVGAKNIRFRPGSLSLLSWAETEHLRKQVAAHSAAMATAVSSVEEPVVEAETPVKGNKGFLARFWPGRKTIEVPVKPKIIVEAPKPQFANLKTTWQDWYVTGHRRVQDIRGQVVEQICVAQMGQNPRHVWVAIEPEKDAAKDPMTGRKTMVLASLPESQIRLALGQQEARKFFAQKIQPLFS